MVNTKLILNFYNHLRMDEKLTVMFSETVEKWRGAKFKIRDASRVASAYI